jgi:two-component system sensor histidine kinase YcbA
MRRKILTYVAMMIAVSVAGELKSYPIVESLRVSLGTPVFFFFLLWSRKIHPIVSGLLVGVAVVLFRVAIGIFFGDMLLLEAFERYIPVFFYYSVFGSLFHFLKVKNLHDKPFLIGLNGIIIEIVATIAEISVRSLYTNIPLRLHTLYLISVIALIRSFFVLGFFSLILIREARSAEDAQRRRNEQMLMLISNLYVEIVQLEKTMKNAEKLTGECYALYRDLKAAGQEVFSKRTLKIAGEIHEMKKDNQRIYAGLSKLLAKEKFSEFMPIDDIIQVIVVGNERYAYLLGRNITFNINVMGTHPPYNTFLLLSVVNNLVANAVEAIEQNGEIAIEAKIDLHMLVIKVKDNGSGISPRNRQLIFTPGFTTKFDPEGKASNGIGLSYVKEMIEQLNGLICLEEPQAHSDARYKTIFTIRLPIVELSNKE